jgi:hypothetical protein
MFIISVTACLLLCLIFLIYKMKIKIITSQDLCRLTELIFVKHSEYCPEHSKFYFKIQFLYILSQLIFSFICLLSFYGLLIPSLKLNLERMKFFFVISRGNVIVGSRFRERPHECIKPRNIVIFWSVGLACVTTVFRNSLEMNSTGIWTQSTCLGTHKNCKIPTIIVSQWLGNCLLVPLEEPG